jgi:TolB-like protein
MVVFTTVLVAAQDTGKVRIAVLQFRGVGIDQTTVQGIEENLVTQLVIQDTFDIVERSQLDNVMKELDLSMSDEFSEETAAEIGNLLGVETVILGSVTRLGNKITINVRGIEVETALARFAQTVSTTSEDQLSNEIVILAEKISRKSEENGTTTTKKSFTFRARPGVSLAPRTKKGIALAASGGASFLAGVILLSIDLTALEQNVTAQTTYAGYEVAYGLFIGFFTGSLVLIAAGIGLSAASIPLFISKDKSVSMNMFFEAGTASRIGFRLRL